MNFVTWLNPAPSCPLPATHPARAHIPLMDTDVRRTWLLHDVGEIRDDYELVEQTDYLERAGQFP